MRDTATVLRLGNALKQQGIFVSVVRPPTVPVSRLRMSVMATHERAHLDRCAEAVEQVLNAIEAS